MDFSIPLYQFNQKLKVLWILIKYSFLHNYEVSFDIHPSGSYQVWLDTTNRNKEYEDPEYLENLKWVEELEASSK